MGVQLVVATGSRAGQVIPIVGQRFVIGRADDCHLKPRSELISRYHCEISLEGGDVFVKDMGSKNGVFLNDKQITERCVLKNGDKLTVGPIEFFVHLTVEAKSQKAQKVQSVSDAVARTVALQTEGSRTSQEDTISDWLLSVGDAGNEETRTVDASELMAHLNAQSAEAANREKEEHEDSGSHPSGMRPNAPASSRDAASELLRKFFKGGK